MAKLKFEDSLASIAMVSGASFYLGWNYFQYLGNYSYALVGMGAAGLGYTILDFLTKNDGELIKGSGIKNSEGKYPLLKRKEKTMTGQKLYFTCPPGLSSYDFEKKKDAIKQYYDVKNAKFCYANNNIIVELIDLELEKEYEFEINGKGIVPILIGKSFNATELVDLANGEPHMIIAGETGSGKSTLLRVIITNLILTKGKKINIHLIDLKNGAEFGIFEKCGNITSFSKTVSESRKVLTKISNKIDERYDLFYKNNCVDIREYNEKIGKMKRELVIIDEFAELRDEKGSIILLESMAARARACGIHFIFSTQRPDKDILTGKIKANMPRIAALKTMNDVNSRIIIGHAGLENLRGYGHCVLRSGGKETECQVFNLTSNQARDLVKPYYADKPIVIQRTKKQGAIKKKDFLDKL